MNPKSRETETNKGIPDLGVTGKSLQKDTWVSEFSNYPISNS